MNLNKLQELVDELIYMVDVLNSTVYLEDLPYYIDNISQIATELSNEIKGE